MKRLLSLVERTGDRLVITDPAGEHPYVLMGLEHYEKLVGGEWKPEAVKHDPAPPPALPISTAFPDNKPVKREIPPWKPSPAATTHASAPAPMPPTPPRLVPVSSAGPAAAPVTSARPRPPFRQPPPPAVSAPPSVPAAQEAALDTAEGEEPFYLEPLE